MAETPNYNLPYPTGDDYVNIHKDIESLAKAVDTELSSFTPPDGTSNIRFDNTVGTRVFAEDSSNNTEVMVYGNTGEYSIFHLMNTNHMVEYYPGTGDITIHRENGFVTLRVDLLMPIDHEATHNLEVVQVPPGFRPTSHVTNFGGIINAVDIRSPVISEIITTGRLYIHPAGVALFSGLITYQTLDPWPTEAPGTLL